MELNVISGCLFRYAVEHHAAMRGWQDVLSICMEVINKVEQIQKSWLLFEKVFYRGKYQENSILDLFNDIDDGYHQVRFTLAGV